MMIGMGLGLLLLVGLLVLVPLVLLGGGTMLVQNRGRDYVSSVRPVADTGSPRELLHSRLARGEISVEQYREIRAEIE